MDTTESTLELITLDDEVTITVPESNSISVDPSIVTTQCSALESDAAELDRLANELSLKKDDLTQGWEGASVAALNDGFNDLMISFKQVSKSVRSIRDWATESASKKNDIDQKTASLYGKLLGE